MSETPDPSTPRDASPPAAPGSPVTGEPGAVDAHPATVGHATPASDACSVLWDHDATSAYGTAARARFFVCVEQPGPWGRDAARESHLDHELGAELDARTAQAGGRFMLVRRPGGHPASRGPQHVLLAHAGERPGEAWLLQAEVGSVGELLGIDWAALARGSRALVEASLPGAAETSSALLVCTNGRRDVCCAVRGRPVAVHASRVDPERVWEVSHTGGHRFAPTAVLLPWGQTYARLDDRSASWVLGASTTGHTPAELLGPVHDRGRSSLHPAAQAAESHVRALVHETHLPSLWAGEAEPDDSTDSTGSPANGDGSGAADAWHVPVTHADGRSWRVRVERAAGGLERPESCGKKAVAVHVHRVTGCEPPLEAGSDPSPPAPTPEPGSVEPQVEPQVGPQDGSQDGSQDASVEDTA